MRIMGLCTALAVLLACACGPNDSPPASARVLAVPRLEAGAINVYLVLVDRTGAMTAADGAATVEVIESRPDPYAETGETEIQLYRGQFPVLKSHFRKVRRADQDLLAFSVGRVPCAEFYERPTQAVGSVKIRFRARYSEEDILGETPVQLR